MLFTEPAFLFGLLPLLWGLHALTPRAWRNALLLAASLVFYWWGEKLVLLLAISVGLNWALGPWIEGGGWRARRCLLLGVAVNLALLLVYKYANFIADTLGALSAALGGPHWELTPVHLPLGISFFTFQAISYLVDIYRGRARAQRSPVGVGLYLAFFPKLIAGPIACYRDLHDQLARDGTRLDDLRAGVPRIVVGLGKKVLLANALAEVVARVAGMPAVQLSMAGAWLGLAAYTLQLYFDFSGYSDMAIGLARIFGIRLAENFDYPLAACSATAFWRRWHISLGVFLRDYLYIPLGGNRHGRWRTARNLWLVFLLCGLWHGASWNFVLWGAWHGMFLAAERGRLGSWLQRAPALVGWTYTQLVWLLSMLLFRFGDPKAGESLAEAIHYAGCLVGLGGQQPVPLAALVDPAAQVALALGAIGAMPLLPALQAWWGRRAATARPLAVAAWHGGWLTALATVLVASLLSAAAGAYTPFLYRQF